MRDHCPGTANIRTPTLKLKACPECGSEIEVFSIDTKVICPNCEFVIYNSIASCIKWCQHAKDCVGEEVYNQFFQDDKITD